MTTNDERKPLKFEITRSGGKPSVVGKAIKEALEKRQPTKHNHRPKDAPKKGLPKNLQN